MGSEMCIRDSSYLHHMVEEVMSKNQGQLEKEKVIETYKPSAEQSLKWYLIRKAIIKDQSIEATKEEIAEFINDPCKSLWPPRFDFFFLLNKADFFRGIYSGKLIWSYTY